MDSRDREVINCAVADCMAEAVFEFFTKADRFEHTPGRAVHFTGWNPWFYFSQCRIAGFEDRAEEASGALIHFACLI